jgi:hypothetical protein
MELSLKPKYQPKKNQPTGSQIPATVNVSKRELADKKKKKALNLIMTI